MTRSLPDAVAAFAPQLPLAVALSGGADSTALLLACARRWPGQVVAIHVHHGLQAAADGFEQHCVALCQRLDIPLIVRRVDARNAPGDSPEDAARIARYQALDAAVRDDDGAIRYPSVALAQHADDQVETMLLALSRAIPGGESVRITVTLRLFEEGRAGLGLQIGQERMYAVHDIAELLTCYTRGQTLELSPKFAYRPAGMRFSKDDEALLAMLMSHVPLREEGSDDKPEPESGASETPGARPAGPARWPRCARRSARARPTRRWRPS